MSFPSADRYWETFHLRELFDEVCRPLQARFVAQAIKTVVDIPRDESVTADRELLRRAVRDLVLNAVDSMPEGGSLIAISAAGPDALELEIADTAELASAEQRGANWGLAVVARIAELHGGSVLAVNCPDGGSAFTLRIPRPAGKKGDSPHLCKAPSGPIRQMGTVPFSSNQ